MSPPSNPERVFDALGNSIRRDILRALHSGPKSVTQIATAFPVSRPAISRHLAQLVEAGLAEFRPTGNRNMYVSCQPGFRSAEAWLAIVRPQVDTTSVPAHKTREGTKILHDDPFAGLV